MILDLRYYGDPVLRQQADPIEKITDEIRQLADDLVETMLAKNGIGIAAPQVGRLVRMFASIVGDDLDGEPNYPLDKPLIYINPVVSHPSDTIAEMNEGCLSLPNLYVPVPRPLSIEIEAIDIEGNPIKRSCYGFLARHLMHENDHLNGVLHIDRVKGKRRTLLEPTLRRIKQEYYRKK